jgi:hypothetical protein
MPIMRSALAHCAVVVLLLGAAGPASAQNTIVTSPEIRSGEVDLLRSQIQREIYQIEQRQLREQDRRIARPERPAVPTPRPSCQIPVFGAAVPGNCG